MQSLKKNKRNTQSSAPDRGEGSSEVFINTHASLDPRFFGLPPLADDVDSDMNTLDCPKIAATQTLLAALLKSSLPSFKLDSSFHPVYSGTANVGRLFPGNEKLPVVIFEHTEQHKERPWEVISSSAVGFSVAEVKAQLKNPVQFNQELAIYFQNEKLKISDGFISELVVVAERKGLSHIVVAHYLLGSNISRFDFGMSLEDKVEETTEVLCPTVLLAHVVNNGKIRIASEATDSKRAKAAHHAPTRPLYSSSPVARRKDLG